MTVVGAAGDDHFALKVVRQQLLREPELSTELGSSSVKCWCPRAGSEDHGSGIVMARCCRKCRNSCSGSEHGDFANHCVQRKVGMRVRQSPSGSDNLVEKMRMRNAAKDDHRII